jgi:hypothetical protein
MSDQPEEAHYARRKKKKKKIHSVDNVELGTHVHPDLPRFDFIEAMPSSSSPPEQ